MKIKQEHGVKTNLITREGYLQLQQEHDHLWNVKRPEVTKIVSWAASLGDRSENADWNSANTIMSLLRLIINNVLYWQKTSLIPPCQCTRSALHHHVLSR